MTEPEYVLRPCGHMSAEGSSHECLPEPWELIGGSTQDDADAAYVAGLVIEGEVAREPEPERWRCPTCGHTFDRDSASRSAYCLGGHRGERRHGLTSCEAR